MINLRHSNFLPFRGIHVLEFLVFTIIAANPQGSEWDCKAKPAVPPGYLQETAFVSREEAKDAVQTALDRATQALLSRLCGSPGECPTLGAELSKWRWGEDQE